MAWSVLSGELPYILDGARVTLYLCVLCIAFGSAVGLVVALLMSSRASLATKVGNIYSWIFRSLPALVTLFYIYYALPQIGVTLDSFTAAAVGLSLVAGAYFSEIIKAGFAAVDRGQFEAARALGLPYTRMIRRIILPQAAEVILSPYVSQCTYVVKSTSLASLIAANELTGNAYERMAYIYQPFEILLIVCIIYLALNSFLMVAQTLIEKRFSRRGAGIQKRY